MEPLILSAAAIGILANGTIYGTDFFCSVVLRSAYSRVDDRTLAAISGRIHEVADRRMPIPGAIGLGAAAVTAVASFVHGSTAAGALASAGTLAVAGWLGVYASVNAPVNKRLTAAAQEDRTPDDVRELQRKWDSVIEVRTALQGASVLLLFLAAVNV